MEEEPFLEIGPKCSQYSELVLKRSIHGSVGSVVFVMLFLFCCVLFFTVACMACALLGHYHGQHHGGQNSEGLSMAVRTGLRRGRDGMDLVRFLFSRRQRRKSETVIGKQAN